jgi:hypothetical protein
MSKPDHDVALVELGELGLPAMNDDARQRARAHLLSEINGAAARKSTRRRPIRLPRVAVAIVGAAVLGTGTAVAAGWIWSPTLGNGDHRGHPTAAADPVPASATKALAVLRREQNDSDRSARVKEMLRLLGRREFGGVYVTGIRALSDDGKTLDALVPVRRAGTNDPGAPAEERKELLCLISYEPTGVSTVCGSTDDLYAGRISYGLPAEGLVPDGVARVEGRSTDDSTVSVSVVNNLYRFPSAVGLVPGSLKWLDAQGRPFQRG